MEFILFSARIIRLMNFLFINLDDVVKTLDMPSVFE